jgi:predicted secreted hydrolase
MKRLSVLPLFLAAAVAAAATASSSRFRTPDAATPLAFPRDHASHDDARVEWWYVTGHLEAEGGKRWGYQLTFFRTGLVDEPREARRSSFAARDLFLAHFALTDVSAGAFRFAERIHRSGPGAALAREDRLRVVNEDWTLEELGGRFVLHARDGAPDRGDELSLLLVPEKPAVLHGTNGLSRKGPEPDAVSRYVSLTRLAASGWLTSKGKSVTVTGTSWMDHEWGPGSIGKDAAGWDWFAVQLADGRDLMLYRMRTKDGKGTPFSSGTLVARDGRATPLAAAEFSIEETAAWTSPRTGAVYPARWTLRVPSAALTLDVVPLVADQELVTEKSTRVTYWEGACEVRGPGGAVTGRAYVEMTGYAGEGALGVFR